MTLPPGVAFHSFLQSDCYPLAWPTILLWKIQKQSGQLLSFYMLTLSNRFQLLKAKRCFIISLCRFRLIYKMKDQFIRSMPVINFCVVINYLNKNLFDILRSTLQGMQKICYSPFLGLAFNRIIINCHISNCKLK